MITKGSFLREKYSDFLSERFNENQVIVKSTNYNRTIKTVQSILSTLYKPKDSDYWDEQLAPLPTPMATLDSIWNLPNCSKYDKLMSQVLKSDEFSEASNYYKVDFYPHTLNVSKNRTYNRLFY